MQSLFSQLIALTCLSLFIASPVSSEAVTFGNIQLTINQNDYTLEYAKSFEQRAQGLMHRRSLCENCGMVFQFEQPRIAGFWMKNTSIPLDIAFVKADGTITDIKNMQPFDVKTTRSSQAVLYAWEMNLGWFTKNGIKVGDTVIFPAKG